MELNKTCTTSLSNLFRKPVRRKVVYMRQPNGLPFTLQDNYSDMGLFTAETEAWDMRQIEISQTSVTYLSTGKCVCRYCPLQRNGQLLDYPQNWQAT